MISKWPRIIKMICMMVELAAKLIWFIHFMLLCWIWKIFRILIFCRLIRIGIQIARNHFLIILFLGFIGLKDRLFSWYVLSLFKLTIFWKILKFRIIKLFNKKPLLITSILWVNLRLRRVNYFLTKFSNLLILIIIRNSLRNIKLVKKLFQKLSLI